MQIVPLQPVPSQTLNVQLDNQSCTIDVYQLSTGLFLNLYLGTTLIVGGAICENLNRLVRESYLGFSGDMTFIDNGGSADPIFTGLGSRFSLAYLSPADLAAIGA
jgi:hypothetical protein